MSFLGVQGKTFLVLGVANSNSVDWAVAKILEEEGAEDALAAEGEEEAGGDDAPDASGDAQEKSSED
jgi:enoyl-[acyl-carrier-protein] reductase (NADH)